MICNMFDTQFQFQSFLHELAQRWANYGPQAACGPRGNFVQPAGQSNVHRWYIFGVYVKVIFSIRLELSSFFLHVSFENAFLLNRN